MEAQKYLEYAKGFIKSKHDFIFKEKEEINNIIKSLKMDKMYDFGYVDGITYYNADTKGMSKEEIYFKYNNTKHDISSIASKIYHEKYLDKDKNTEPLRDNYRGY